MHELRRPERVVRIRRDGAGLRRSGSRLQGVGDEIKAAFARGNVVLLGISQHFDVRTAEVAPNERNIGLGDGEVGVDRVEIVDRDEDRAIAAGRDRVADIDLAQANAAIDWRANGAVIEIHLRRVHRRLRPHGVRPRGVEVLSRGDVLGL